MIECYCNQTTCNNVALMQDSKVADFGPIACELMHGGENDVQSCEGAYCEMSYSMQDDGTKNVSKRCVSTAFPPMMLLELKPDPPAACVSMTSTLEKQDGYFTSVHCMCASAMCNKDEAWLKQLPSSNPKQQVTCYQQQCTALEGCTDYGTCQGDFCYENNQTITFNGSNNELITMGCMNTSQPLKGKEERKVEEGFLLDQNYRSYQKQTVRICATDYCIMKTSNAKQFVKPEKSTIGSDQKQNTDKPTNQPDNSAQNQNNGGGDQSKKNAAKTLQYEFFTLQIILVTILTFALHYMLIN